MAKKSSQSSKPKPIWLWVKTNEPDKPTNAGKAKVMAMFEPHIQ